MSDESPLQLTVEFQPDEEIQPDEHDDLTRNLLTEIDRDVDVVSADVVHEEAPDGTRGVGIALGTLAVAVLPVALEKLLDLVIDWSKRNEGTVTLKFPTGHGETTIVYNPKRTSPEELKEIIRNAVEATKGH